MYLANQIQQPISKLQNLSKNTNEQTRVLKHVIADWSINCENLKFVVSEFVLITFKINFVLDKISGLKLGEAG